MITAYLASSIKDVPVQGRNKLANVLGGQAPDGNIGSVKWNMVCKFNLQLRNTEDVTLGCVSISLENNGGEPDVATYAVVSSICDEERIKMISIRTVLLKAPMDEDITIFVDMDIPTLEVVGMAHRAPLYNTVDEDYAHDRFNMDVVGVCREVITERERRGYQTNLVAVQDKRNYAKVSEVAAHMSNIYAGKVDCVVNDHSGQRYDGAVNKLPWVVKRLGSKPDLRSMSYTDIINRFVNLNQTHLTEDMCYNKNRRLYILCSRCLDIVHVKCHKETDGLMPALLVQTTCSRCDSEVYWDIRLKSTEIEKLACYQVLRNEDNVGIEIATDSDTGYTVRFDGKKSFNLLAHDHEVSVLDYTTSTMHGLKLNLF
jgi:hypothetical protein